MSPIRLFLFLLLSSALTSFAQKAPFAYTSSSTPVTFSKALVRGVASLNNVPATAWFEWGEGATYTNHTPVQALPNTTGITHVSAEIDALSLQKLYLARLVVSNELGIVRGKGEFLNLGGYAECLGPTPEFIPGGLFYSAVTAGNNHNLFLRRDGTVLIFGRLTAIEGSAFVPPGLTNITAIASGPTYCLALRQNGTVVAWGGQTNIPPGLTNVVAIAAGQQSAMALREDGTVAKWGSNASVPASATNVVAIASGDSHCLALRDDGTVVWWNSYTNEILTLTNITAIAAGGSQSLALRDDGAYYQFTGTTSGTAQSSNVVSMAAGTSHFLLVRQDGTVIGGGDNFYKQINIPADVGPVISAAGGRSHSALFCITPSAPKAYMPVPDLIRSTSARLGGFVTANGWGGIAWYEWGILGADLSSSSEPIPVIRDAPVFHVQSMASNLSPHASYHCRLVLSNELGITYSPEARFTTGSKLTLWGRDSSGSGAYRVPPGLGDVVLADGGGTHTIVLTSDGKVRSWGSNKYGQTDVPSDLGEIANVSAGGWHSVALLADGTVRAWGQTSFSDATKVPAGTSNIVQAVAGGWHVGVLRNDGTVDVWGGRKPGPLYTNLPLAIVDIVSISTSGNHMLALRRDGRLFSWGVTTLVGTHNISPRATNVVSIYAAVQHNLVTRGDGSVISFGKFTSVPADLTNAIAVSAGWYHSTALRSDGTLTGWMSANGSAYPEATIPPGFTNGVFVASGDLTSMALGSDVPAIAVSMTATGQVSADLVIPLPGYDPNGDPFTMRVTSLPTPGALYQFDSGRRGAPILLNDTVTDPLGRVIFVPMPGESGMPYSSFDYVSNDHVVDSTPASVTIYTVPILSTASFEKSPFNGVFSLQFNGLTNASYRVWGSTNLIDWMLLGSPVTAAPGVFSFSDSSSSTLPKRFYQITCP